MGEKALLLNVNWQEKVFSPDTENILSILNVLPGVGNKRDPHGLLSTHSSRGYFLIAGGILLALCPFPTGGEVL